MSSVTVTNLQRDTVYFHPVYRDGKVPKVNSKTGAVKDPGGESFKLELGSQDDNNDEAREKGIMQPEQDVPRWALDELRKIGLFQNLEKTNAIKVSTPA